MVLPSNASPNTQPDNHAANFTVDWETPVELDPNANWKVAMTEINYIYQPHTISSNLSILYRKMELSKHSFKFAVEIKHAGNGQVAGWVITDLSKEKYKIAAWVEDGHLVIGSHTPFDVANMPELGFIDNGVSHSWQQGKYPYRAMGGLSVSTMMRDYSAPRAYVLEVVFYDFYKGLPILRKFKKDENFKTLTELADYLRQNNNDIFSDVSSVNRKLNLQLASRVHSVKFQGGLNFILGYNDSEIKADENTLRNVNGERAHDKTYHKANFPPQLKVGIRNMYIYASFVAPVYVGHTRLPLLKNIFVDSSNDVNIHGHARNSVVQHLMYVDVNATTLNSITVNIRNDAGNIVAFPRGSITVITVHFKKFPKQV
jgi:hypothetical protein